MFPHRALLLALTILPAAAAAQLNSPSSLGQQAPLGSTLSAGGSTASSTVYFTASSNNAAICSDPSGWLCSFDIELRPTGTSFTGTPTHNDGGWVSDGNGPFAITGLSPGSYHWQIREADDFNGRSPSSWVQFNSNNTAFTVASVYATPTTVAFGSVKKGTTSASANVGITNSTASAITLSAASVSGPFAIQSGPSIPATVAAGATATFAITATPQSLGSLTGSLSVTHSSTGSPISVSLTVTGAEPKLTLSTSSVSFGSAPIYAPWPATQSVQISNTGTYPLTLAAGASVAAPFTLTGLAGTTIPPGGSTSFSVGFTPSSSGSFSATLSIASDDPASPHSVSLSGTGLAAPLISATPSPVSFGSVGLGASGTATLTVSNPGTATLTVQSLQLGGANPVDFGTPTSTPFTVAAGGSFNVGLSFEPGDVGPRSAELSISSDAHGAGTTMVVLDGDGDGPRISVNPASLSFGSEKIGKTVTLPLQVLNVGTQPLVIQQVSFSSGAGADYSASLVPPETVAPGASISMDVIFQPTAGGLRSAKLAIGSNDVISPALEVPLSGTGLSPLIDVLPDSISYGQVRTGTSATRSVYVRNDGDAEMIVSSVSISGDQAAQFSIPAQGTITLTPISIAHEIEVTFSPTAVGAAHASLTFVSDDPLTPQLVVPLEGEGTAPAVTLSATGLDFGGQKSGRTSAPRTVTVTNSGSARLQIHSAALAGQDPDAFALVAGGGPSGVDPGAGHAFTLSAAPQSAGEFTARLVVETDAPGAQTAEVSLRVLGVSEAISVSPATLDFGAVLVGRTRELTLSVGNLTSDGLGLDVALEGPGASGFTVLPMGTNVPALQSVPLTVAFVPTSDGAREADLVVTEGGLGGPPLARVHLLGNGVANALRLEPATVDFGAVELGATAEESLSITNLTSSPVSVVVEGSIDSSLDLDGAFPLAIEPGASATVPLRFTPGSAGPLETELTFAIDGAEQRASLPVRGTGVGAGCGCGSSAGAGLWVMGALAAVLIRRKRSAVLACLFVVLAPLSARGTVTVSPNEVDFGDVALPNVATAKLLITNTGSAPVSLTSVQLFGPNAARFTFSVPSSAPIPAGSGRTVTLFFKPTALGPASALLQISTSDPVNSELKVPLMGVGTAAQLRLSKTTIDFGLQLRGRPTAMRTFRISNPGDATLNVVMMFEGLGTEFFSTPQQPGTLSVPPFGSVDIGVVFHPLHTGTFSARLILLSNALGGSRGEVLLTGKSTAQPFQLSSTVLDFGSTALGTVRTLSMPVHNVTSDDLLLSLTPVGLPFSVDYKGGLVPASGTLDVSVGFSPTLKGTVQAQLPLLLAELPDAPPFAEVTAIGEGVEEILEVPVAIPFGPVDLGARAQETIELKNLTERTVIVTALASDDPDFGSDAALPLTILRGESAKVGVWFAPSGEGADHATIVLQTGTGEVSEVKVNGTGTVAEMVTSGGCDATGALGAWAVLGWLGVAVRRRRWSAPSQHVGNPLPTITP